MPWENMQKTGRESALVTQLVTGCPVTSLKDFPTPQGRRSILLERRQFISAATPTNCRSTLPPSTFLLLLSRPVLHLQFGGIRFGVLRVLILFFFFDFDSCASISIWMVSPGGNTRAWTYGTWANYPIKRQHFVLSHCRHRPQLQLWSPACVGLASNRCPNIDIWCVLFVGMAPWRFWVRFESCSRGVHN